MTFEQGGIFIVPHLLWHGTSFLCSHSMNRSIVYYFVALSEKQVVMRTYFNSGLNGYAYSLLNTCHSVIVIPSWRIWKMVQGLVSMWKTRHFTSLFQDYRCWFMLILSTLQLVKMSHLEKKPKIFQIHGHWNVVST